MTPQPPGEALYQKLVAEGRLWSKLDAERRLRGEEEPPTSLDAIRERRRREAEEAES
jgi:hypothetical protein